MVLPGQPLCWVAADAVKRW